MLKEFNLFIKLTLLFVSQPRETTLVYASYKPRDTTLGNRVDQPNFMIKTAGPLSNMHLPLIVGLCNAFKIN
jgi:hypothetical protein